MVASGGTSELGINMPSITGKIKYAQACTKLYSKTSSSFTISRAHPVRSDLNGNPGNKLALCHSFANGLSLKDYHINYCLVQMKQFFIESEEKHSLAILRVGRI